MRASESYLASALGFPSAAREVFTTLHSKRRAAKPRGGYPRGFLGDPVCTGYAFRRTLTNGEKDRQAVLGRHRPGDDVVVRPTVDYNGGPDESLVERLAHGSPFVAMLRDIVTPA